MAKADVHLSLIMPGLFNSASAAEESSGVTELKVLLARSKRGVCAENPDALLFELFGCKHKAHLNLPVAPVTHASDSAEDNSGYWLCADPVHMRADGDRVMMMGNDCLDITFQEAVAFGEALDPLFRTYSLQLETQQPKRWYVHLPDDPGIFWHALADVRGHDIHQHLPLDMDGGAGAKLWRRILNEAQMILHGNPVNHQREARGEPPINSLWFWGGGILPWISSGRFVQVWGNNALTLGLAKLSATPRTSTPATGADWLVQAITPGAHLVIVEPESVRKNNIELLNKNWFSPLLAALKSHQLKSLQLYTGNGVVFHATPESVARWWKRPRSLAVYQAQAMRASGDFTNHSARLAASLSK